MPQRRVLLVDHNIAAMRHVALVQAFDVQAHVVPRCRGAHALVVHLNSEHFPCAWIGSRVRRQESDLFAWLHDALLDAPRQDVSDALDLVDAGDGHAHGRADRPLGHAAELVEGLVQGLDVHNFLAALDILSLPPVHVLGSLKQVVADPTGYRQHRHSVFNELFLEADVQKNPPHFVGHFHEAVLPVGCRVAIHLVHPDYDLLDPQEVDKPSVLTSLPLITELKHT
mmetsp:Transcript_150359/g.481201  ORF Transcript_150359/g.481201 Transcript_150359/m.481201 type:complete len:226 (-) Transcript_150359:52-729(-)